MKKIKLLLIIAASLTFLSACGQDNGIHSPIVLDEESISPSTVEDGTNSGGSSPINIITEDDSQPPRAGMLRSRLTNEWVDAEVANTRPIAVITPNESPAIPHYNLSNASILYEANVEGRMTRMLAIYEDWQELEKIGNIRSLRTYYAYWAFEWDAFLVHFGGPFFIDELIAQPNTQYIDGNSDSTAFFRTSDRPRPHNAYAAGKDLLTAIKNKDYSLSYRGLADDKHYNFATKAQPNTLESYGSAARNASYIDMSGCYPLTRCYFQYNEEDGLYYRYQHLSSSTDGPHMDAATGEQLSFKNILVQNTKSEDLGDGYLAFQYQDTTNDGWFFTNGKGIHVTWEKTSDYGATRYYDDDGIEITLNAGKTMICIVQDGDTFTYR